MKESTDTEQRRGDRRASSPYPLMVMAFSLVAIIATFLLSNSSLDVVDKTRGFSAIIAAFLIVSVSLHLWQSKRRPVRDAAMHDRNAEIERGLNALDEAGEFFAGSLKPADAFRLVSSRVRDLLPFRSIVLYLLDPTRSQLKVAEAEGAGADGQRERTIAFDEGLAGQCYLSKRIEVDGYLALDETQAFGSSVAVPLCNGTEVFGVLQFYFEAEFDLSSVEHSTYEAVGTRVSPLVLSSIAYERSQVNALTDFTTDLPNERAFYLVLENQLAEAQRKREERPLTILAIDIKNFDEINQKFGHAAGDRILNFVAQIIKDNLRQMDFLSRSIGDEYLAILPTASKKISHEVIARIHTGFFGRKLKVNDQESVEVELNVGWATFGHDGETPGQLLSLAQLRKEQVKSASAGTPHKVLWFPQDTAN
ncbi:hypothetical protein BH10ACI3_BH10ACI3_25960 [soil metagenome]